MVFRWFCFIFILNQFINWCKRTDFNDYENGAEFIGVVTGVVLAISAWVGSLWFTLFSQFN